MCTMTWLRYPGGYQVFFNRDELRTRAPSTLPAIRHGKSGAYIAPLDGDFGGSWLAVNRRGVTLALQNGRSETEDPPLEGSFVSRGLLLARLIDAETAEEVLERLLREELRAYRPFLLTAFEPERIPVSARWSERRLAVHETTESRMPLVSSSFDTDEVRRTRFELFREMRDRAGSDAIELHLRFHESHLPRRGPLSPCMHRPDARTVSFSWIRVEPDRAEFRYVPHPPCRSRPTGPPVVLDREIR